MRFLLSMCLILLAKYAVAMEAPRPSKGIAITSGRTNKSSKKAEHSTMLVERERLMVTKENEALIFIAEGQTPESRSSEHSLITRHLIRDLNRKVFPGYSGVTVLLGGETTSHPAFVKNWLGRLFTVIEEEEQAGFLVNHGYDEGAEAFSLVVKASQVASAYSYNCAVFLQTELGPTEAKWKLDFEKLGIPVITLPSDEGNNAEDIASRLAEDIKAAVDSSFLKRGFDAHRTKIQEVPDWWKKKEKAAAQGRSFYSK